MKPSASPTNKTPSSSDPTPGPSATPNGANAQASTCTDERLRLHAHLLEGVRESVVASDLDGRILYWGPGAEQLYGYQAEEVLGQPYRNFAGASAPPDEATFRREILACGHWEGEHVQKHRNGQTFWTATRISVFPDDQGRPAGFIGIDRDVSERKRRELRLAKINECFLNLGADFAANVDRFVALAGEGLDGACALYNRLEEGLLCSLGQWHVPPDYNPRDRPEGHICYDLIRQSPAGALVIRDLPRTDYARTDPNVAAYGLRTYVGQTVKCNDVPVGSLCVVFQKDFEPTDDDRWLLGIIAAAIGVEENRRRAEEILRQSEEKFAKVFRTSPYASLITRAGDGRVLDANDAFSALFGHAKTDLLADSTLGVGLWARPEDRADVLAALRRGETVANREFRFRAKDGREIIGLFSTQLIPIAGEDCLLSSINDVTERQQAAERLRESESRLAAALDMARAGYWEYDVATDVFTFNDAFYRVYKTTAAQAGGYRMSAEDYARRFCHPDDAGIVAGKIAAALACTDPDFSHQFEHRIRCGDGTTGHVAVRFFVVKDEAGRTVKTYGVNQNVTERKQAEDKLRANLERLQDIAANLPGAIYQLQTGRTGALEVPYMSSGCEALFERPVAELDFTGLLFDRMHIGDRALFEHSLAAAAQKSERWSLEFRVAVADGRTKWLRASANPRTLPNGAILWTGVLLDITRLKQAEEARRESEERFHLLVKNASDVIAVIDAAGILKYVSPAEEPISGFRPDELTGKSIRDVIHPDDLAQTLQAFQTTVAQPEKSHRIECRHLHKTRGWLPVEIVGQSYLAEPAVKGVIVSVRDATERKKAEEEQTRQFDELRRWYAATLGREGRIAELKREVNALARRLGDAPPYASAEGPAP